MADNLIAGIASVAVNGNTYSIVGEGTWRPSSTTNETLKGQDGVHGVKAMPEAGKISWNGRDSSGIKISDLNDATDATVVLSLVNGKTIIGRNMWRTGDPIEVNSEEASFAVAFEGPDVTEN